MGDAPDCVMVYMMLLTAQDPMARYLISNCLRRQVSARFSLADVCFNLRQMCHSNAP